MFYLISLSVFITSITSGFPSRNQWISGIPPERLVCSSYRCLHHLFVWLPGNSQNIQTETGRADQPPGDMQQCHQQTEKVSEGARPQTDPVSFLGLVFGSMGRPTGAAKVGLLSSPHRSAPTCDDSELNLIGDLKTQIKEKENVFFDMEAYLPKRNGLVWFFFFFFCRQSAFNLAKVTFCVCICVFSDCTWIWCWATWT